MGMQVKVKTIKKKNGQQKGKAKKVTKKKIDEPISKATRTAKKKGTYRKKV